MHKMTCAPGLKLLLGCLSMLWCQILRDTGGACWWRDPSGGMWAWKEGPLPACPRCKLPPPIWHRVAAEFDTY
eukprot:1159211-Pelagomonas_calceolata.AAC.7